MTSKVFKNRPSKICWRHPLKKFTCSILEYFVPFEPITPCYIVFHLEGKKGANKISFIDLDEISSKNLIILIGYYTSLRPTIFHQENMQCRTKSISFWALFETHYLWNTWPKWAGFLDSQHVVSETVSKVEFFEKKCSNRQVINKKSVIW